MTLSSAVSGHGMFHFLPMMANDGLHSRAACMGERNHINTNDGSNDCCTFEIDFSGNSGKRRHAPGLQYL